jgi:beta-glucosidase
MICYKDANGHTYDFGFGMNWKGVIHDARTEKYVDVIKKPKIEIKGGVVTITCASPGVRIYYTTDGATPAFVEANEYSKPFKLTGSTTVKAIAKKYGFDNSSLADVVVK